MLNLLHLFEGFFLSVLCRWHFLQTHHVSGFSVPLAAQSVHLCCRHHHHWADRKAVMCVGGTYLILPPSPPCPPLPQEHDCRSEHGSGRLASLGKMTCLVVEWVSIPRLVSCLTSPQLVPLWSSKKCLDWFSLHSVSIDLTYNETRVESLC